MMKLLYCEILGFGKLKNMRVDFTDGLNAFLRENGWGKTTLCAFIKDMLYGMGDKRSKSIAENERIKYEPWSSQTYGGALGFAYNGKQYRIERTFGKTPSQDTFRIYDEGSKMLSYDFSSFGDRIGEAVFGLDKESFERALFFSDEHATPRAIDGDIKNNLCRAITNSQGEDIDGAIERIENAERALKAKRRPAQGAIDEIEENILRLRERRRALDEKLQDVPFKENQMQELDGSVYALNEKIEAHTAQLIEQGENSEAAVGRALHAQLTVQLDEAKSQLQTLTPFFAKVNPESLVLDEIQTKMQHYARCKQAEEQLQSQAVTQTEKRNKMLALTAQKTELERSLAHYRLAMQEKGEQIPDNSKSSQTPRKTQTAGLIFFALTLCAFIVGALFLKVNATVAAIIFAVGTIFFFVSVSIAKKVKSKGAGLRSIENSALQTAYLETQKAWEDCEEQLRALGDTTQNVLPMYQQAKQDREEIEASLHAYFSCFPFGEIYDLRLAFQTLSDKLESYHALTKSIQEKSAKLQSITQETSLKTSGYSLETLKQTLYSLNRQKEELLQNKHRLQLEYESLLEAKIEAEELCEEEKLLIEQHDQLTRRYDNLQTVKALLQQAKANLSDKYLSPVANACQRYLTAFPKQSFTICFDGKGEPVLKDNGFYRHVDFYSQGNRRLMDFCIRLSVIETVYQTTSTLLVFDDPFAEFDDETFKIAKQILTDFAKNRQIIYFTCSQSRV